jgi:peptidoglycan-associated lipoprotein
MTLRSDRRLTGLVLALAVLLAASACGKKRPPALASTPGGGGSGAATDPADRTAAQPLDEGPDVRAMEGEGAAGTDLAAGSLGTGEGGPLADIHFEYDSANLTEAARAVLEKHALWLQGNRDARVTIEGHCDERGTVDYNLALGEQRARATRDYLVSLGVSAERLRVVSYGKERPLDPAKSESAYGKNRRAHFTVSR